MRQTVFYADLSAFCHSVFVARPGIAPPPLEEVKAAWEAQEAALFELFLLFDKVVFRVEGESILIPVLTRMFGSRGLDALIDQDAIGFVLWDQSVMYFTQNIRNVDALVTGHFSNPEHSDPETSIEAGLKWMTNAPTGRPRTKLVRKMARLYAKPDPTLVSKSADEVKAALRQGHLNVYGLPAVEGYIDQLDETQRTILARCCNDFAEYSHLLANEMTSFGDYRYFSPFWKAGERFRILNGVVSGFSELATIHGVPDLKEVYRLARNPLQRLPLMRNGRNAKLFRQWLSSTVGASPDSGLLNAYIDAVADRKGFLQSTPGRVTKSVVMASISMGVGGALGGVAGAIGGTLLASTAAEKIADFAAETTLGLFDSMLLERVLKGWSPRMFFDDLMKIQTERQ